MDGHRFTLRVGINSIGRAPQNDLILESNCISRRHCIVLVHATGSCEIHDTASRNGTLVNNHLISRVDLLPGDMLKLCDERFLLAWVGPDGEILPEGDASDTWIFGRASLTA
jgi:pSer/pThr/pTyr-binding forkhead associated (FHA) protein